MAKEYELTFKVTELSENDFAFLANSGNDIYNKLLNNKVELRHNNHIGEDSSLTHKQRMINWLRKNSLGLWFVEPLDKTIMYDARTASKSEYTSLTFVYFELTDDVISFKMRWNE